MPAPIVTTITTTPVRGENVHLLAAIVLPATVCVHDIRLRDSVARGVGYPGRRVWDFSILVMTPPPLLAHAFPDTSSSRTTPNFAYIYVAFCAIPALLQGRAHRLRQIRRSSRALSLFPFLSPFLDSRLQTIDVSLADERDPLASSVVLLLLILLLSLGFEIFLHLCASYRTVAYLLFEN